MDEQDRITHGAPPPPPPQPPHGERLEGEAQPIPPHLRQTMDAMRQRLRETGQEARDIVREYEERYGEQGNHRPPHAAPPLIEGVPMDGYGPLKAKRHEPLGVSANERKWAALAHASTLLTALVALPSAGLIVLLTMFAPLLIYFAFRQRSEYVAFHALQAFTMQLIGTIGFLFALVLGLVVWTALLILSLVLIVVAVGIVLTPVVALAALVYFLAVLLMPLGMTIYSMIAMVETWNGHNYRVPYIARWVESQMYSV